MHRRPVRRSDYESNNYNQYDNSGFNRDLYNPSSSNNDQPIADLGGPYIGPGADLRGAHLEGRDLYGADLRGAHLERAHLEGAILTNADLEGAFLQDAHLEGANLFGARLGRAHLRGAHLERADLRGANLMNADLEGVDLTRVIMGDEQRQQIAYSRNSRALGQQFDRMAASGFFTRLQRAQIAASELARQQRASFSNQGSFPAQFHSQRGFTKIINIPRNLQITPHDLELRSKNNSANKSCPNFRPLYNFIMEQELTENFRFRFEGQNAVDLAGLTRILFDKILPIYIVLFFIKQGDFILLKKDVHMDQLNRNTLQLIKLAKAAHSQIQLQIHPVVIELLSNPNLQESIATRQNFSKLYANFKAKIKLSGNNVSNFLINNTLKSEINASQGNLAALSNTIKAEILFRKTLVDYGFTSWDQYHNMALFIKTFWNISNQNKVTTHTQGKQVILDLFVPELNFDIESFISRLKIIREDTREPIDIKSIPQNLLDIYPALRPLSEYILNQSEEGDNNRKTFVKYVAGTEYYPGEIVIKLTNSTMSSGLHRGQPFYGHSCFSGIDLYKAPPNFRGEITQNVINTQLKATTSSNSNLRAEE